MGPFLMPKATAPFRPSTAACPVSKTRQTRHVIPFAASCRPLAAALSQS